MHTMYSRGVFFCLEAGWAGIKNPACYIMPDGMDSDARQKDPRKEHDGVRK